MEKKIKTKAVKERSQKKVLQSRNSVVGITILLALLISAGAYFFMIKPQLDRVGPGKELDLASTTTTLEQQKKVLSQLKMLQGNFEEISSDDIALLSNILPSEDAIPELLTQLETIALSSGVDLTRVSLSEIEAAALSARQKLEQEVSGAQAAQTKGVREVMLQMEIDAFSYESFKKFVSSLENHARIIDVETFNFQTENERQRVVAKTFYFPE